MIRTVIVDDEPLARDTLRLVLSAGPEVEVVGSCTGVDAVALVAAQKPDLLFLDVQMPEVGGFDVVEALPPGAVPAIVFVTAWDQYAVRAFDVHALDYLLKPFDDRRLRETMARVKARLRERGTQALEDRLRALLEERVQQEPRLRRFVVRGRSRTVFVDAAEVDWLEAADDYVELHCGQAVHIVRERLSDLEQRLDPQVFARVHRSTIVNVERVREMHPMFRGDALLVLRDGTRLRLSRSHRAAGIPGGRDEHRQRICAGGLDAG